MLNEIIMAALETAHLAENAWSDELKRVYGKEYREARYDNRNKSTPELALLYSARRESLNLWHKLCDLRNQKEAA